MSDVIVIGGGPAGLHLSKRVGEMGYSALLIDDRRQIGLRKICTGIIGAEAYQELDLPTRPVLSEIQEFQFVSPNNQILDYRHDSVLAKVVDRTLFDAELAERACSAGVQICSGLRVSNVTVAPDGVTVTASPAGLPAEPQTLRARFVVVATGVGSRLHRQTELGSAVEFLNAVQAHIRVIDFKGTRCFTGRSVAPGAFAWIVPLGNGWGRVGLMSDCKASPFFERFVERIREFRSDDDPVDPDYKPIVQRFVGPSFAQRVLAVGEAAGQVKTTTGGGISYGLMGAEIGAGVVDEAFKQNQFSAQFLQRYEERWKSRLGNEITTGYRYRKLYSRLTDRQINALFKFANSNGLVPLVRRRARFDWHADVLHSASGYGLIPRILGGIISERR